jgi:hypothetical protein
MRRGVSLSESVGTSASAPNERIVIGGEALRGAAKIWLRKYGR